MMDIEDFEKDQRKASANNALHILAMLSAAGFAWQLYGFWFGVLVFFALFFLIGAINMLLLVKFESVKFVRINRWFWVVFAHIALALSAAEIVTPK